MPSLCCPHATFRRKQRRRILGMGGTWILLAFWRHQCTRRMRRILHDSRTYPGFLIAHTSQHHEAAAHYSTVTCRKTILSEST